MLNLEKEKPTEQTKVIKNLFRAIKEGNTFKQTKQTKEENTHNDRHENETKY